MDPLDRVSATPRPYRGFASMAEWLASSGVTSLGDNPDHRIHPASSWGRAYPTPEDPAPERTP